MQGFEFRVQGLGLRVTVIAPVPPTTLVSPLFARTVVGAMPLVEGLELRFQGLGFRVGFRV